MEQPPRHLGLLSNPKTFGLAAAALAMALLAWFAVDTLTTARVAGSSNPAPPARVLAASVTVSPLFGVPNQTIAVSGSGFSNTSVAGGGGPNGTHQITGEGGSYIRVAGVLLGPPHANYPINLDSGGNLATSVIVPVTGVTLTTGEATVEVTDDRGVTATGRFILRKRTFTISPTSSGRGSTLTATVTGFPASNPAVTATFPVRIDYAGTEVITKEADSAGSFQTSFTVPLSASIPSTNTVTATIIGKPGSATATHTVPGATIEVIPVTNVPGRTFSVIGYNFPAFIPVTFVSVGGIQALVSTAATTDANGVFNVSVLMPRFPVGDQAVMASAGGVTAVGKVTIVLQLPPTPTPTPLPTPTITPTPAITPTPTSTPPPPAGPEPIEAFEPILENDNLQRVWHFDNPTKTWTFFDSREAFEDANTITEIVPGRVYWMHLALEQVTRLNDKIRVLIGGWNLLAW